LPDDVSDEIAAKLRRRAFQLAERVKELDCLYSLSKLADHREMQISDFLQRTVEMIPDAWQYPEIACARVTVDEEQLQTDNFVETAYRQEAVIIASGGAVGRVEVCYREERPECDEGPFLREERRLINAIAQQVGETIERKRTEQQLLGYRDQLRSLTEELVRAEERERRRIAEDLHDQIGQTLASVKMRLTMLLDSEPMPAPAAKALGGIRSLVEQAIGDTRFLIFDLSPPILYEFGLIAAFSWLVEETRQRYDLKVELVERGEDRPINVETRAMLFRAVRELIANAAKHARARTVRLSVDWRRREIRVRVEDDGVGFDVPRARRQGVREGAFGLFSIQERIEQFGGRFQIDSGLGEGTRTSLTVPLNGDEGESRRET
jgi:signal transduction histidine kinase